MKSLSLCGVTVCWAFCSIAQAQSRPTADPRDEAIFGKPPPQDREKGRKPPRRNGGEKPTSQPVASDDSRDMAVFGGAENAPKAASRSRLGAEKGPRDTNSTESKLDERLRARDRDTLQFGGQLYLRFNFAASDGSRVEDHLLSMPNLLDAYLDGRPNERIRAFARGRLSYDPTIGEQSQLAALSGTQQTSVQLIELWLKFDIGRRLFVTIGQQRILWGTTRLWNPVDFVNQSQRPLLNPFDARGGVPMIKLHLPIESLGWNFYLAGLLDDVATLDKAGVVGRAEIVLGTVELGLNGAYRQALDPRLGIDLSAGIWHFELTGELALRFDDRYADGVSVQTSVGLQYQFKVFDDDTMLLGSEYFFNQAGTDKVNPLELFDGTRQFFYAGKHYLALFALLPRPGRLDDWTFTLSGVGNLSDQTFISRFDVSISVLTYLRIQLYAQLHFGRLGELRIGDGAFPEALRPAARAVYSPDDPTRKIPTQFLDLGVWLSVDL